MDKRDGQIKTAQERKAKWLLVLWRRGGGSKNNLKGFINTQCVFLTTFKKGQSDFTDSSSHSTT